MLTLISIRAGIEIERILRIFAVPSIASAPVEPYKSLIIGEEEVKTIKVYEMDRLLKPDIRLSLVVPTFKENNFLELLSEVATSDKLKNIDTSDIDPELKTAIKNISESYKNLKNLIDEGYFEMNEVVFALKSIHNSK